MRLAQTGNYEREDMDRLFRAWGRLPRIGDASHVGYPSIATMRRLYSLPGQTTGSVQESEDDLVRVDRAISSILNTGELAMAFTLYYGRGEVSGNIKRCAQYMGIRRTTYEMLLSSAIDNVTEAFHELVATES